MKQIEEKETTLVSVAVVTYNSSKYVEETLESIYNQTYKNIELIISDDSSSDETVTICKKWIKKNNNRFTRVKLLITGENKGIPANCNQAINEVKGEWVKIIAGDDALFEDAINLYMDYVMNNTEVSIFSSKSAQYKNTFEEENFMGFSAKGVPIFFKLPTHEQYSSLLYKNRVSTIGVFLKKKLIEDVGGFDERLRFIEDHPLFLNISKQGEKIFFMNKLTVKYRIHDSSVRTIDSGENVMFNKWYLRKRKFEKLYIYPNVSLFGKFAMNYEYYRHYLIDLLNLNKKHIIGRGIYFITGKISPFRLEKLF